MDYSSKEYAKAFRKYFFDGEQAYRTEKEIERLEQELIDCEDLEEGMYLGDEIDFKQTYLDVKKRDIQNQGQLLNFKGECFDI